MTIALTTPRTWVTGEVPTAALLNTYVRDNGDYFTGETVWATPTLTNGWVNFVTAGYSTAGYRKIGDIVWLKGTIKNGTVGSDAFTLPTAYRPTAETLFATESNSVIGRVDVTAAGAVMPIAPSNNAYVMLDGLFFSTI